jgi:hypothetical protein
VQAWRQGLISRLLVKVNAGGTGTECLYRFTPSLTPSALFALSVGFNPLSPTTRQKLSFQSQGSLLQAPPNTNKCRERLVGDVGGLSEFTYQSVAHMFCNGTGYNEPPLRHLILWERILIKAELPQG